MRCVEVLDGRVGACRAAGNALQALSPNPSSLNPYHALTIKPEP